jgi:hypothetical protein
MKFKIVINQGMMVPKGYGVAILKWCEQQAVCYPFGIHIVIALCYRAYCYLAYKLYSRYVPLDIHNKEVSDAYADGMKEYAARYVEENLQKRITAALRSPEKPAHSKATS